MYIIIVFNNCNWYMSVFVCVCVLQLYESIVYRTNFISLITCTRTYNQLCRGKLYATNWLLRVPYFLIIIKKIKGNVMIIITSLDSLCDVHCVLSHHDHCYSHSMIWTYALWFMFAVFTLFQSVSCDLG